MMGHRVSNPVMHDKHQNTAQPGSKGTPDSAPEGLIFRGTQSIASSTNTVRRQALLDRHADGPPVSEIQRLTVHASVKDKIDSEGIYRSSTRQACAHALSARCNLRSNLRLTLKHRDHFACICRRWRAPRPLPYREQMVRRPPSSNAWPRRLSSFFVHDKRVKDKLRGGTAPRSRSGSRDDATCQTEALCCCRNLSQWVQMGSG